MSADTDNKGWGVIRPGDHKSHYYINGTSLCGRISFYRGPLEDNELISPDDCAACRKKAK